MLTKNRLVHAVIWPNGEKPEITLTDKEGVIQSYMRVRGPMRGDELSRMIPDGFIVDVHDCSVVNLSGKILVGGVGEFDTSVVTEKATLSFEERMNRLERIERRRQRRQADLEAENKKLREELRAELEAEAEPEPEVVEAAPEAESSPQADETNAQEGETIDA